MKFLKTKVQATPKADAAPVLPAENKVSFETAKKPRKNRFQAAAHMQMMLTLAMINDNWTLQELGRNGKNGFRLSQNIGLNPAVITLKVVDEKLVMNSVARIMVTPAPVKSKGWKASKVKEQPAELVEVRKELVASKASELKHLENHIISFS